MRDTRKSAVTLAGAGALAVLLATSAFAQNTPRDAQSREGWNNGRQRAAASNDGARNHAQSPSQNRQNAPQVRQVAPQVQQTAPQYRQAGINQRDSGSRSAAQSNRGYQTARANDTTGNGNWGAGERQSVRGIEQGRSNQNNERVTLSGHVSSFTHEGGGYRVHLDRDGRSFWIPESRLRNRNDLRVGLSLSLGGIFNGSLIDVDAISYPGAYAYASVPAYDQGVVQGVVDRVDYRTNTILVRDEASGRFINVDMRGAGRTSGVDTRNVRPGDYLTLSGQWDRGGVFVAYRVDNVNTRPY